MQWIPFLPIAMPVCLTDPVVVPESRINDFSDFFDRYTFVSRMEGALFVWEVWSYLFDTALEFLLTETMRAQACHAGRPSITLRPIW